MKGATDVIQQACTAFQCRKEGGIRQVFASRNNRIAVNFAVCSEGTLGYLKVAELSPRSVNAYMQSQFGQITKIGISAVPEGS
ncbi:hypothetical protein GCM10008957_33010 [Deinococcus ruber]|uniref:Uncharacterized protein n=1 Tax=Deinococcus ruber TaxID=1848197 RepID=A0A918CDW7_9DEIO|nr:hypothetical protein [Deinococcus ruber]GGR17698.1 hypothetical protein GCM10008957_33010 [Deinococcus ruber]